MTEKAYVIAVTVAGLCFLGVLVIAAVAILHGRGMNAEGQVKLGKNQDVNVRVSVPTLPESSASTPALPFPPLKGGETVSTSGER